MVNFLYRKTQSGSSTKAVIFPWKEATGSPQTPLSPTLRCCRGSNVLLHKLPPPTSQDLSRKDMSESSGLPSTPYRCKNHCMKRKEHVLDWGFPAIFPNRTSEQSSHSSELYPTKGSEERKTVLRQPWSANAWASRQCTFFLGCSEMGACPNGRGPLC